MTIFKEKEPIEILIEEAQKGDKELQEILNYEVVGKLGRGGFGTVYQAIHKASGKTVAIKVMIAGKTIKEEEVNCKRFKREIAVIKRFDHPNIVKYDTYKVSDHNELYFLSFLVLEYCNGGNLADLIDNSHNKIISIKESLGIINQALDGLIEVHKEGIHRDIKPENILLNYKQTKNGELDKSQLPEVKISDFGVAKAIDSSGLTTSILKYSSSISQTNIIESKDNTREAKNKAQYLPFSYHTTSRNLIRDWTNPPITIDIWSMAATLYYMLTGCYPRDFSNASNELNILEVIRKQSPISLSTRIKENNLSIPEEFDYLIKVIDNALNESQPYYQTAAELKKALNKE